MLFDQDQLPDLVNGTITRTYRVWKRPQANVGGQYRLNMDGVIEVDALSQVKAADITDRDAQETGFMNKDDLLAKLRQHATVTSRTVIYCLDFHYVPLRDPREVLAANKALSEEDAEAVSKRLQKMDRLGKNGPWTAKTLALIEQNPGVVSTKLAAQLGRDRDSFKTDVRKLKKLGLTISLEVGYELSPRGKAYLAYTRQHAS